MSTHDEGPTVAVATRDTATWKALRWQARVTWLELLRKAAPATGTLRMSTPAIPAMLGLPGHVARPGIEELLRLGCVDEPVPGLYVVRCLSWEPSRPVR